MKNTLIVFETVPESVTFFLIPNDVIDEKLRKLIEDSTGRYINYDESSDLAALNELYTRLFEGPHYDSNNVEISSETQEDLVKYSLEFSKKVVADISHVHLMGFYA